MQSTVTRPALWIGATDDGELGLARESIGRTLAAWQMPFREFASPCEATAWAAEAPATPAVALLATDWPARWTLADTVAISRAWPLMPIVSVAGSLVDGRRRSGPPLPGVEEVPWYDLPGRLESWFAAWRAGKPGTLTNPSTARRDERLLGVTTAADAAEPLTVSIVAGTPLDAEGIATLVPLAGGTVVESRRGRPPLDESAEVLVWDVGRLSADTIGWLGILAANRPALRIVIVESFPRGDSVQAAFDAGAAAVLGKPLSAEALFGTFRRLKAGRDGLGAAGAVR